MLFAITILIYLIIIKQLLMKTLVFLLALSFNAMATSPVNPLKTNDPLIKMINRSPMTTLMTLVEEIQFKMEQQDVNLYIDKVNYNTDNANLTISATRNINFLQVVRENGTIDYQLPIFSETVTIDLEDLEKGNWQLNLMIDNDTIIPANFTNL